MCTNAFRSLLSVLVIQFILLLFVIHTQNFQNNQVNLENDESNLREGVFERDDNFIFNFSGNISGANTSMHKYVVVCNVVRSEKLSLTDIQPNICTHILYRDKFLSWWSSSGYDSSDKGEEYHNLVHLKRNTKIFLQIHDRIDKNQKLSVLNKISRNKKYRDNFVNDTFTYLKRHNLDGLDVVVLTKTLADDTELKYRKLFADFLPLMFFELRSGFKPNKLQLTMTLLQVQILQAQELRWMGFPRMLANVDLVHLLSYISLINPVYDQHFQKFLGIDKMSTDLLNTVKFISEDFKFPSNKVVIGFESHGFIPSSKFNNETRGRFLGYKEVCETIWNNKDSRTFYYSPSSELSLMKTVREWVLFESSKSITRKIERGLQEGVKGFMLTDISNDDPEGESCGTPFPLLRTINSVLTRLAASPNEFFTLKGTSRNRTQQSFLSIGPNPNHNKTINCDDGPSPGFMNEHSVRIARYWHAEIDDSRIEGFEELLGSLCTTYSPLNMLIGVNVTTLEIYPEHLNDMLHGGKVGFHDIHFQFRITVPNLKLLLKLMLVNREFPDDYTSLIKTIAYPAANRLRFIKGISNTLRDNQLDGIELIIITSSKPISPRLKSLVAILFHDLHKELNLLHLTLGLYVEYDTKPSNYLTDQNILKHVDYINIIPYSREMHSDVPNPSVLADESLNYFIEKGVPPSKIITGMLGYAQLYWVNENSSFYVPRNEACYFQKREPERWTQSHKDGMNHLTNGIVTWVWATDGIIKRNIQAAIDIGVKGFMVSDMLVDSLASSVCTDEYLYIKTIHNVLTEAKTENS